MNRSLRRVVVLLLAAGGVIGIGHSLVGILKPAAQTSPSIEQEEFSANPTRRTSRLGEHSTWRPDATARAQAKRAQEVQERMAKTDFTKIGENPVEMQSLQTEGLRADLVQNRGDDEEDLPSESDIATMQQQGDIAW